MENQPPVKKKATASKKSTKKTTTRSAKSANNASENRVLPGLLEGLQSVFDKIHKDNQVREDHQDRIIEEFSDRLTLAFEQSHQEALEREKLLQEKLETIEREQTYRIQRIKFFSLPGTIIAVVALGYLFYVVHVMERSMTSMSSDMHNIQGTIADIGQDTRQMSGGVLEMNQQMAQINQNMGDMNGNIDNINTHVRGMNGNMRHLNRSVGVMTNDVGAMSQTVSPVMGAMRSFMPMF